MDKKFTGGDWEVEKSSNGIDLLVFSSASMIGGRMIQPLFVTAQECVDPKYRMDSEELEANMKLAAAAPVLLAACQKAIQSEVDGSFVMASNWWDEMKYAIKKATE